MRHSRMKRLLSFLVAAVMVLTLMPGGAYATEETTSGSVVPYEPIDGSDFILPQAPNGMELEEREPLETYDEDEVVRVTVIMEGEPAIAFMNSGDSVNAPHIVERRKILADFQKEKAEEISNYVLRGEELDVVSNMTLVMNAISINIEYGLIEEIMELDGIVAAYVEPTYQPMTSVAEPSNIVAQQMTGASSVVNSGYTGAGSRIAIIDGGTDTDHQSLDGEAFEYSLAELAERKGMTYEAYVASLDLLSMEEIADVLPLLHAYEMMEGDLNAADLYLNSKLPFNFCYVDRDLDVTHDNDGKGDHGSHVAGIAAANRYIKYDRIYDFNGDGSFNVGDAQAMLRFAVDSTEIYYPMYADLSGNSTVTSYDVHELLDMLERYENGDIFVSARDTVYMTGVAPDAQLITMKVFGDNGGAYVSEYMCAVEDAVTLGCDVVNLSLGSPYPGFLGAHESDDFWTKEINRISERLSRTNIVMSVAAGNNGNWADKDAIGLGMTYTDEAGTYNISQPATYQNTMAVASVDNVGGVSAGFNAITDVTGYYGFEPYIMEGSDDNGIVLPWSSLSVSNAELRNVYDLVFLGDPIALFQGGDVDTRIYGGSLADFDGYDFTGKVVLIARGTYNFYDKQTNAALAGAAAVLIYNNVPNEYIRLNLTGTEVSIPAASISLNDAYTIYRLSTLDEQGLLTTKLIFDQHLGVDDGSYVEYPTMSSFSSWGTTGALEIKPDITTPGANIYSLNGVDTSGTGYQLMDGTSMAAPHFTGLVALMSQYIRENDLEEKTGLTARQLAQSLLMSTATPLIEVTDRTAFEYSVRNQGAGMANVAEAMLSNAFITVEGETDGKVKAEIGDGGAERTVTYTITNFGETELTYNLSSSILTTQTAGASLPDGTILYFTADQMIPMGAKVTYSCGNTLTVGAGESVTVTATIVIPDEAIADMNALGYVNGFYIEGYLYLDPVADSEGIVDAAHSIPVLGWYGNWLDPSMYECNSTLDYIYGTITRPDHTGDGFGNLLGYLPFGVTNPEDQEVYTGNIFGGYAEDGLGDARYLPERNAISNLESTMWSLGSILPSLIRNACAFKVEVTDSETGELYFEDLYPEYETSLMANFYYANKQEWYNATTSIPLRLEFNDAQGKPLASGTRVDISLITIPDLFVENLNIDWDSITLGKGSKLTFSFTIDNEQPELVGDMVYDATAKTLKFQAQDNNYVASVILLDGSATYYYDAFFPDMDADKYGTACDVTLDLSMFRSKKAVVCVCDYAGNMQYYAINLGGEGTGYGELMGFSKDSYGYPGFWTAFDLVTDADGNSSVVESPLFMYQDEFTAAEYVSGLIYAQDDKGNFYGIPYEDMLADTVDLESCYLTTLDNLYQDLAFNYRDGKLYGITVDSYDGYPTTYLYEINLGEAFETWDGIVPTFGEYETGVQRGGLEGLTLAFDDEGTAYMLGHKYIDDYDENDKYYVAASETAYLWTCEMIVDEWSSELMFDGRGFTPVGDMGVGMDCLQSMTWDHNTEKLYWARFDVLGLFDFVSELIEIDVKNISEDGKVKTTKIGNLSNETCALIAPLSAAAAAKEAHKNAPVVNTDAKPTPSFVFSTISLAVGGTKQLTYKLDPWYAEDTTVIFTSSDETIATVDATGKVTAKAVGFCDIIITNSDGSKQDTCSVVVADLNLCIEGIISDNPATGVVTNSRTYSVYVTGADTVLVNGEKITASEDKNFGLSMVTAAVGFEGEVWTAEGGNAGMLYKIDPVTGEVLVKEDPFGGDMIWGLSYSGAIKGLLDTINYNYVPGKYTAVSNNYLIVDMNLPRTPADKENAFLPNGNPDLEWHKWDMLPYLRKMEGNFVTGETGNGAKGEIVFSGITSIDYQGSMFYTFQQGSTNAFGEMNWSPMTYKPATTHVLLDNVGRMWYIDEITNLQVVEDDYGICLTDLDGITRIFPDTEGTFFCPSETLAAGMLGDEEVQLYNAFYIREIKETVLTDMFYQGTLPGYTYHFNDFTYVGNNTDGAPVFALSLYDYWGDTFRNELYLYVDEASYFDNYLCEEVVKSGEALFHLGNTGKGTVAASVLSVSGNLPCGPRYEAPEEEGGDDWSGGGFSFIGFYEIDA